MPCGRRVPAPNARTKSRRVTKRAASSSTSRRGAASRPMLHEAASALRMAPTVQRRRWRRSEGRANPRRACAAQAGGCPEHRSRNPGGGRPRKRPCEGRRFARRQARFLEVVEEKSRGQDHRRPTGGGSSSPQCRARHSPDRKRAERPLIRPISWHRMRVWSGTSYDLRPDGRRLRHAPSPVRPGILSRPVTLAVITARGAFCKNKWQDSEAADGKIAATNTLP